METKPFKVREIVKRLIDNRGRNADYYMSEKYPVIDNYMIKNELYPDLGTATRFLSEEQFRSFLRGYVEKNDLLMTLVGGVGNVTLAPSSMCAIVQNTIGISFDEKICDNFYAYYYFKTIQYSICSLNRGVSQPSVNREDVLGVKVWLPSIKAQKRIVGILETFDRLIEINNKRIKVLEQMAENLYKEWFVRFRFPGHESVPFENGTPKGWERVMLNSVLSKIATGLNPRQNFVLGEGDNYYITIKNMGDNDIFLDEKCDRVNDEAIRRINKRSDLRQGDLLFSGIGTIGRVYLIKMPTYNWNISESVFTMRPNERINSEYLYMLLLSEDLQNYCQTSANGAAQKGIRMADLVKYSFWLPPQKTVCDFTNCIHPILEQISLFRRMDKNLVKQRDLLLPRLMSGKLEV